MTPGSPRSGRNRLVAEFADEGVEVTFEQPREIAVRGVNGYGARCGCGGESVLHLRARPSYGPVTPERSRFLCAACVEAAVDAHMAETGQPSYWPGDEDRDQPYERPVG